MNVLIKVSLFSSLVLSLSCSMLSGVGPKANVSVVKTEIKRTKKVGNILIAEPLGLQEAGAKAFTGAAVGTYTPPQGQPMEVVKKALAPVGLPGSVQEIILASYQVEFNKLVEKYEKKLKKNKKAKAPSKMRLPSLAKKLKTPKSLNAAKALKSKIKKYSSGADELAGALKEGDMSKVASLHDKNKPLMRHVNGLTKYLIKKNKITYMVLTYVKGSQAEYDKKKAVRMTVAMVNVKTGRLRYFATVKGQKGTIPLPWEAQILSMSNSIFSGAEEKAPIPGV